MNRYVYLLLTLALAGALSVLGYEEGRIQQQAEDQQVLSAKLKTCRSAYLSEKEVDLYGEGVKSRDSEVAELQAEIRGLMRDRWVLRQKAAWLEPYENCVEGKCLAVVEVTK